MEFGQLLSGVFNGLLQIYPDMKIGGVKVDFFLPEWNIVVLQYETPSLTELELIREKIVESSSDDVDVEFPVVFFQVLPENHLETINSILRIASCDLYWCPNGHEDHSEWVSKLNSKKNIYSDY
jgi:hypothetical protein